MYWHTILLLENVVIELNYANFFQQADRLADNSFNVIMLDMPWGRFGPNSNHPDVQWDYLPPLDLLGDIVDRLLDMNGYVVAFGDQQHIRIIEEAWSNIFTEHFQFVWAKPNNVLTNKLKPMPIHEFINVYMHKEAKVSDGTWNPWVVPGRPYKRKGTAGAISTRRQIKGTTHENSSGMRYIKSVIHAPNKPAMKKWERMGMGHPTLKSVQLISQLLSAFTNPGDSVLDPFSGNGSIPLSCFLKGRKCSSYEHSSKWYSQSILRFNRVKEMLGPAQVEKLIAQPDLGIDEFDTSTLFS